MDEQQKINILQEVIRIKTANSNEREVAVYYSELLRKHGIQSQLIDYAPGRSNLIAEIKGNTPGRTLAFNGHMDVVSEGDATEWRYPPYAGIIRDGKMYGRGTTDMKAGLTAMVLAMIRIKEMGTPINGTLRLVAVVGEEVGMLGSKQIVEEHYVDDIDGLIIGEPTGPDSVVVGHKGSIQYQIVSHGKAAHSSMPQKGINSLIQMTMLVKALHDQFEEISKNYHNPLLGSFVNVFSMIEGGQQINSVPRKTTLKGNARTIPEFDNKKTLALIRNTIKEINKQISGKLELHVLQNNSAVNTSSESALIEAINQTRNTHCEIKGWAAATDASNFVRLDKPFDLAIYGPGDIGIAHTVNEFVSIKEYLQFIDDYAQIAINYLGT